MSTGIQWTDETWNPVTGCSKVSPGCAHCYAEGVATRFWSKQYPPVRYTTCSGAAGCTHSDGTCAPFEESRPRAFEDVMCHEDRLDQPLRWRRPRRIFVNSMSDLFHEDVPDGFIDRVFAVMAVSSQHTFQVLTKRAERMRAYVTSRERYTVTAGAIQKHHPGLYVKRPMCWPLPNIWLGVSVENQRFADERIPLLLETPAAVRFISAEPLLGPVDLSGLIAAHFEDASKDAVLDWVIVGGESGVGSRPFDVAWARSIVQQCQAAGVACFVKQLGSAPHSVPDRISHRGDKLPKPDGFYRHLNDKKGGAPSEWPEDLRVREFPKVRA